MPALPSPLSAVPSPPSLCLPACAYPATLCMHSRVLLECHPPPALKPIIIIVMETTTHHRPTGSTAASNSCLQLAASSSNPPPSQTPHPRTSAATYFCLSKGLYDQNEHVAAPPPPRALHAPPLDTSEKTVMRAQAHVKHFSFDIKRQV